MVRYALLAIVSIFFAAPVHASEGAAPATEASAKQAAKNKKAPASEHAEEDAVAEELGGTEKNASAKGSGRSKTAPKLENVCLGSPAVIEELKQKQKEIAERERALTQQAEALQAKETILMEEFAKLTKLREEVQGIQSNNKKMSEESIVRMVETVEKMSPKSAAQLLSKVNEPLAVEAIARLSTPKLAKVLAAMDANKASTLTEGLTRRGTKKEGAL